MLELIIVIIIIVLLIRNGRKKRSQGQPEKVERERRRQHIAKHNAIRSFEASRGMETKSGYACDDDLRPASEPVNQAKAAAKAASGQASRQKAKAGRYSVPRSDLRSGTRHEEWQAVPNGYRVCSCGYCAAENCIPANDDPKKYRCYFCHVQL